MMKLVCLVACILPCVLSRCCFHDQLSGTVAISSYLNPSNFLVDFTTNKFAATRKDPKDSIKSLMIDLNTEEIFVEYRYGNCYRKPFPFAAAFIHCIPDDAIDLEITWNVTIPGVDIWQFDIENRNLTVAVIVLENTCLPFSVMATNFVTKADWRIIYSDLEEGFGDRDVSVLDQDTSNCKVRKWHGGI